MALMQKLPPELVVDIFAHLPSHTDIGNIRLVSKDFNRCSLHLLVPRVVIAERPDSLRRLRNIIHHPVLSQCVTELVWDASAYNESISSDFENYIWACEATGREFKDTETAERDLAYTELCRTVGVACVPLSENLTLQEMDNYDPDTLLATGMHGSFGKYAEAWRDQCRVGEDGLHFVLLRLALQRLSKLRKIIFTDFRELTRPGEDYDQLCHRLFGNVLEPDGLDDFPSATNTELVTFKRIVDETRSVTTLDVSVRVHQCGSSPEQPHRSPIHCCQPETIQVVDIA